MCEKQSEPNRGRTGEGSPYATRNIQNNSAAILREILYLCMYIKYPFFKSNKTTFFLRSKTKTVFFFLQQIFILTFCERRGNFQTDYLCTVTYEPRNNSDIRLFCERSMFVAGVDDVVEHHQLCGNTSSKRISISEAGAFISLNRMMPNLVINFCWGEI